MSPLQARALIVGDYIAIRRAELRTPYSNVGRIVKKTATAIFVRFNGGTTQGLRFALAKKNDLRKLRHADLGEVAGYKRAVE